MELFRSFIRFGVPIRPKACTNLVKANVLVNCKGQSPENSASALTLPSSKRVSLKEMQGHYLSGKAELGSKGNKEILMFNAACTLT